MDIIVEIIIVVMKLLAWSALFGSLTGVAQLGMRSGFVGPEILFDFKDRKLK